jgi:hypothetical protein
MRKRDAYRVFVRKSTGKRPFGRHGVDEKLLNRIFKKMGLVWTASIWLRIGTSNGLL